MKRILLAFSILLVFSALTTIYLSKLGPPIPLVHVHAQSSGIGSGQQIVIPNASSTGTTINTLTKLSGAPSTALIAATTDTSGQVGITIAGAGTTGAAVIQTVGIVPCVFSNASTAGHYVQISGITAGNCADTGASTYPVAGQVIGRVLSTNGSAGTFLIDLFPAEVTGYSTGGVASVSGDGSLITNSASSGAVTLTIGNAGAYKYWGNSSGTTGAPGFNSIVLAAFPSIGNATFLSNTSGGSAVPAANSLPTTLNALILTSSANGALGSSVVTDNGTTVGLGTNFTVTESTGVAAKVAGITTVGLGIPVVGWKSNVTGQSTSQSSVTLATTPTAGDYLIDFSADMNTACTTGANSVSFTFGWTDASNARTLTTGVLTLGSAQSTSSYLSGVIPLHVGSGSVTYTSTVNGTCATGTSQYDINAWMVRAN